MLVPDVGDLEEALAAPRLLLLIGKSGCIQCTDLAVAATAWSNEERRCVLVHLDDDAGRQLSVTHPFLAHLDVLPAVVPMLDGAPLEVLHGHEVDVLVRAWSRMEA